VAAWLRAACGPGHFRWPAAPASTESVTGWAVPIRSIHRITIYFGLGEPFADTGATGLGWQSRGTSGRRARATWIATSTPVPPGIFLGKTRTVRRAVQSMPGYQGFPRWWRQPSRLLVTTCEVTGNQVQPGFRPEFGNSPAIR
jgi:hypothetical protein